jgi:hypothetical protein
LIATDLDGTLIRRDGTLSKRTIDAVAAADAAGVIVVLVTARPPRFVSSLVRDLSCHSLAICSNGALIYDAAEGRLVGEHPISPKVAVEVVRKLRAELHDVTIAVEAGLRFGKEPGYQEQWPLPADALVATVETLLAVPMAKLLIRHAGDPADHWPDLERARAVVGELVEVTSSGPGAPIEISAVGVSKAFALGTLAADLGVDPVDVVAFGDMPNDLPMLGWAGLAVAPANAHPDVLAAVNRVTFDCDEDGVAVVIEGLLASRR